MEKTWSTRTEYNYVYIVDIYQIWFLTNWSNIVSSLKNIINKYNIKNKLFIGDSSGGYSSILFGNLLNATKIIAFNPQIKNIESMHLNVYYRKALFDKNNLKNSKYINLQTLQPFSSLTKIYFCSFHEDIKQINNLDSNDKNLILKCVSEKNTHDLVGSIGKDNYIQLIIDEIEKKSSLKNSQPIEAAST